MRVWNIDGDQGSKPLHTFHGHTDDIRCLAWYGVDVNTTDHVGISPLMTAAELGLEVSCSHYVQSQPVRHKLCFIAPAQSAG